MSYLRVNNIGKAYKRYARKYGRLAEWMGLGVYHEPRWVLQNISFDVKRGESIGIVGVNGAGKSTLLKIITGTTKPTTGTVEIDGRISALLELGMGFHPEFTGRQNAYMSAQLAGLKLSEINDKIDEIEAFAEVGDYFNQPMRTYSTGMHVRVAFAVATCVRPEILIVDEALSVGDAYFQHKCMQRIRNFREQGTTLLFVSHSPDAVRMLCERGIMLSGGTIERMGDAGTIMDYYRASQVLQQESPLSTPPELIESESLLDTRDHKIVLANKTAGLITVDILSDSSPVHSGDQLSIRITAVFQDHHHDPHIGFGIRSKMGIMIYEANTYTLGHRIRPVSPGEKVSVTFSFPCLLAPDTYELMVGVANGGYDRGSFEQALFFDQSFMLFEVAVGTNTGWGGIYDIQPIVEIN